MLSDLEDPTLAKPWQKLESSLILMRVIPGTSIVGSFTLSERRTVKSIISADYKIAIKWSVF